MKGRFDHTIRVIQGATGLPEAFFWRGRQIGIAEILDDWEETGCWWLGEKPRRVFQVLGANGALYELHCLGRSTWQLYRVLD